MQLLHLPIVDANRICCSRGFTLSDDFDKVDYWFTVVNCNNCCFTKNARVAASSVLINFLVPTTICWQRMMVTCFFLAVTLAIEARLCFQHGSVANKLATVTFHLLWFSA